MSYKAKTLGCRGSSVGKVFAVKAGAPVRLSRTHIKSRCGGHISATPELGKQKQEDSRSLLVSQPSQSSELQVQ